MQEHALDLDFFEHVFLYKSLTDEKFLGSIVDIVKPAFFKDRNIKTKEQMMNEIRYPTVLQGFTSRETIKA